MSMPFVGEHRREIVDRLVADFHAAATGEPRITYLEAPLGWGKTRIVHELYAALAGRQRDAYWPSAIVTDEALDGNTVSRQRKRLTPGAFSVGRDALPEWVWLGIASDPSVLARPEEAHQALVAQLEPHLYPILRRRKLQKAALKGAISLLGALLPVPVHLDAVAALAGSSQEIVRGWWDGTDASRVVGGESADYSATLWRLLTTVWGENGTGGPPIVIVIEDAQFLGDKTIDLLQLVLASKLPIYVLATGWPLTDDDRYAPFRELVTSRPATLRVEQLLPLTPDESADLIETLHPGTPAGVVDVLVRRFGANPYGLQLFLFNHDARRGEPCTWEDVDWLEQVPSGLHTELRKMLEESDRRSRVALCAAALLGYRLPVVVGDAASGSLGDGASIDAAFATDWVRLDRVSDELFSFVEPIRHETATMVALDYLSPATQRLILDTAMRTLESLLTDDIADPDRALLDSLYIELSERTEDRDEDLLVQCIVELLTSLWRQRALGAAHLLLGKLDAIVDRRALTPHSAATLALHESRHHRLLMGQNSVALDDLTAEALALAEALEPQDPEVLAMALLERSRWLGSKSAPGYTREGAESAARRARALVDAHPGPSASVLNSLRSREYSLTSSGGERERASRLALAHADWCAEVFGPESNERVSALSDAAHYLARIDPGRSIAPSRHVVELVRAVWGTDRHPRVASLQKDLAVRMLHTYDDELLPEASDLINRAHRVLAASLGLASRHVLTALSAKVRCQNRLARRAWLDGDRENSEEIAAHALADASHLLSEQRRVAGGVASIHTRALVGSAVAWSGDPAGLAELRECLEERRVLLEEGPEFAEVLWLVRDLRDLLVRHDRPDEAAALRAEYPAAFCAPYPTA